MDREKYPTEGSLWGLLSKELDQMQRKRKKMSYYSDLLEKLQKMEVNFIHFADKIEALKPEVRYILPYMASGLQTEDERYSGISWQYSPDHIVAYMMKRTLYIKPEATDFYCSSSVHDYDWLECAYYVLDNLKYAQCLEANQNVAVMEQIKEIEEKLRNVVTFCMLVGKWNFEKLDVIKAKLQDIYKSTDSVSRAAAYAFRLFLVKKIDASKVILELANILRMINRPHLLCEEVYLEIMEALRLLSTETCLVRKETVFYFIHSLKNVLNDVCRHFHPYESDYTKRKIEDILFEMEFVRTILEHPLKEPVSNGIVEAIATHIEVLAAEAICVVTSSVFPLPSTSMIDFIRVQVKNKNRKDTTMAHSFVDDFLKCFKLLGNDILSKEVYHHLVLELTLLRTCLEDADELFFVYPKFGCIRKCAAEKFREAWWDIRSQCFLRWSTAEDDFLPSALLKEIRFQKINAEDILLGLVESLLGHLRRLSKSSARVLAFGKNHVESLRKELILLRCILMDPLKMRFEDQKLNDLFKEIKVGAIEAGNIVRTLSFEATKGDVHFPMLEKLESFKATVRRAYSKLVKSSPSKLPISELKFFDILSNLKELKKSMIASEDQIGAIYDDLVTYSSFLRQNAVNRNQQSALKHIKTQILNVGCRVGHVLDSIGSSPDWFIIMRLNDVAEELKHISEEIKKIISMKSGKSLQSTIQPTQTGDSDNKALKLKYKYKAAKILSDEACPPTMIDEVILKDLKKQLTTGRQQLEIVSIVGMPGVGKTTLAMKVYKDVAQSFDTHAWCYVSQDCERKGLLKHIITEINVPSGKPVKIDELNEGDLAQLLYQNLFGKRYLIVLDDIWDNELLSFLKACFPNGNDKSKILLTSRFKLIGLQTSPESICHELRLLSVEKSWQLLEKMVFGTESCPMHLCAVGQEIAKRSEGLPLSIVLISGVLRNVENSEHKWRQVKKSLETRAEDKDGIWSKLEVSYDHLSICMKQCFLYCGTFFKGREIPRSKLVQLLIAERFILETNQLQSLEDAAEDCLSNLVNRSLLMVTKRGFNNRIQTFRIHDLLRDFCTMKAEQEKFVRVLNRWGDHPAEYSLEHRLSFRCKMAEHLTTGCIPRWPSTQSLQVLSTGYLSGLTLSDAYFIVKKFMLLRILDLENIDAVTDEALPENRQPLVHLRYLALPVRNSVPSSIGKLLNLEVLIVRGTRGQVTIPSTIFNLTNLRHLRVNCYSVVGGTKSGTTLNNLQSFSRPVFSLSTAEQVIRSVPNLRKLKCVFLNSWDNSIKCNVFPALNTLRHLESLNVCYAGQLQYPCKFSLPTSLKKLTLSEFRLPWSEMEMISQLPQLEVLKVINAFRGQRWNTSFTFLKLKYLRLDTLDFEEWEASDDQFPELERLVVQKCKLLKSIPSDFSDIGMLKCIEINWCNHLLVQSAIEIEKKQRYCGNKQFRTITQQNKVESSDERRN